MRSHIRLLSLVARATVVLLAIGAFLVVLGIFDGLLATFLLATKIMVGCPL